MFRVRGATALERTSGRASVDTHGLILRYLGRAHDGGGRPAVRRWQRSRRTASALEDGSPADDSLTASVDLRPGFASPLQRMSSLNVEEAQLAVFERPAGAHDECSCGLSAFGAVLAERDSARFDRVHADAVFLGACPMVTPPVVF